MSGLLYYLPGENAGLLTATENWLAARERHGLADTLADVRDSKFIVVKDVLTNGPDGGAGCIVASMRADGEQPTGVGFFKGKQTWAKTFGSAWVGFAELPKPEWLQRRGRPIGGALWTEDCQARPWLIPVARRPGPTREFGDNLPTQLDFDEELRPTRTVRTDGAELWELSGRYWDGLNQAGGVPLTADEKAVTALKALAWFYRIGPAEIRAFAKAGSPILDDDTADRFCLSLIHWDLLAAKAEAAPPGNVDPATGSSSWTGSPDETQAGDLVEANSH